MSEEVEIVEAEETETKKEKNSSGAAVKLNDTLAIWSVVGSIFCRILMFLFSQVITSVDALRILNAIFGTIGMLALLFSVVIIALNAKNRTKLWTLELVLVIVASYIWF